jgi:hypothetical protein
VRLCRDGTPFEGGMVNRILGSSGLEQDT